MTCEERRVHRDPGEQERLFNVWANEHGKQCPECRRMIEKSEGCNHMTCLCGAHFCWKCGKSFSADKIYGHMDTAHGGMHDQAPDWANPNDVEENIYEEQARLLAQVQAHRVLEIENARVRLLHEQDAIRVRRQNAQRAQMIEVRRRQIQLEHDEIQLRQLQNDVDEARRRREAARAQATVTPTRSTTRDGNWCIVM